MLKSVSRILAWHNVKLFSKSNYFSHFFFSDEKVPRFIEDEHFGLKYWEQDYLQKQAKETKNLTDEADYYTTYLKSFQEHLDNVLSNQGNENLSLQANLGKENKIERDSAELSHSDENGKAKMVDVTGKKVTGRTAVACSTINIGKKAFQLVKDNEIKKGDVLSVAHIAGIMGAKQTSSLIPLCHPLSLTNVNLDLKLNEKEYSVDIMCEAKCSGQTGVEMEALIGASLAALTVYDMCKAVNKKMVISDIKVIKKTGGKSDFNSI